MSEKVTVEQLKTILDQIKSLPPPDQARFQLLVIVDCIEKVAYYGFTALVAFALGRRIIQGILTGIRESRPVEEPPPAPRRGSV